MKLAAMLHRAGFVILPMGDTGPVIGYRNAPYNHEPIETMREPDESDVSLLDRSMTTAKPVNGLFVLSEIRTK